MTIIDHYALKLSLLILILLKTSASSMDGLHVSVTKLCQEDAFKTTEISGPCSVNHHKLFTRFWYKTVVLPKLRKNVPIVKHRSLIVNFPLILLFLLCIFFQLLSIWKKKYLSVPLFLSQKNLIWKSHFNFRPKY